MPNWCMNSATFKHVDRTQLERIVTALEGEYLFEAFVPCPDEDSQDWYSHGINEWGCKWDVGGEVAGEGIELSADGGMFTLTISFDSAWSPPISFYEHMVEQGFDVIGRYYEPGMAFCGVWDNGDDQYYEIPETAEEVRDQLPEEIDEYWCISEQKEDWEQENWHDDGE